MLVYTTSSLARRFNAVERPDLRRTDGSAWDNDNVRRFLDAMGVVQLPRKPKGKIRYAEKAIKDAIPEFWEALLDDEKRLQTAQTIESEDREHGNVHADLSSATT